MRHPALLTVLALTASCSFPQHVARTTYENTVPTDGVRELLCESHNGDITVRARPGATEVAMHVTISVRGHTPQEAEDNLRKLAVHTETSGDRLILSGRFDRSVSGMSPSFSFELEAPPHLAGKLTSHNGDIRVSETAAALDCETHNGDIDVDAETNDVRFVSHNGDVHARLDGAGALNGVITTHNGDITVQVAPALGTSVRASTTNGSIDLSRSAQNTERTRRFLSCDLGAGAGRLALETHNGNVEIR